VTSDSPRTVQRPSVCPASRMDGARYDAAPGLSCRRQTNLGAHDHCEITICDVLLMFRVVFLMNASLKVKLYCT
jgi:hypothetical protein